MKERMKLIGVYSILLWKRMWKTHKILFTFIFLPFLLLAVTHLVKEEETKVQIAVYIEGEQETLKSRLEEKKGALTFTIFDSEEEVKQEVAAARAECGYCIPADLQQCIDRGKYTRIIKSYESPQSSLQTICEEALFAEIFSLYEEVTFGEQAAELVYTEIEKTEQSGLDEEEKQQLVVRAEELLEKYRYNGSTFQFSYEVYSKESAEKEVISQGNENSSLISIKGIMALTIYVCGLCGTLDALEDEKKGRIARLKGKHIFQLLTIYIPVFMMSVVTWICFIVTGEMDGIVEELLRLCFYQLIMVVYCLLLKKLCRKEERLAAAMPVLILCSVIVCPVFIDLSQFIPIFEVLEKAFPMSYYLR